MQFAFCIETLYPDLSFPQKLEAARRDGIEAIEIWDWRDKDYPSLPDDLKASRLKLCNLSGNRSFGMVDPRQRTGFLSELEQAARFAQKVGCPRLMLLAQALLPDGRAVGPPAECREHWLDHLRQTAAAAAELSDRLQMDLLIEPLNDRLDHPGYLLHDCTALFPLIREIHHPRLKALYDIYHMSVMEQDVIRDIRENQEGIGYFHLADIPGRTEPGPGRIPYAAIIGALKAEGYSGILGLEFFPGTGNSSEVVQRTLERLREWVR